MNQDIEKIQAIIDEKKTLIKTIRAEMSKRIVGQDKLINILLIALFTRGHVLLEGVPGLAKTTAISTLSQILHLKFQRIQFTPDLLPSDLIGNRIYNQQNSTFLVKKGPIFANFILADEINRSPAKVQSALLEAMQEKQVTIGEQTFELEDPFFVMATQNPLEQEGVYALPEAQVDRFLLKTVVDYPSPQEELKIINMIEKKTEENLTTVIKGEDVLVMQKITSHIYMDDSIKQYIVDLVTTSRNKDAVSIDGVENLISCGASPRGSIGLMQASKAVAVLNERAYVIPEDVKEIALDVLRHRIIPTYEAEAEGIASEDLVKHILEKVRVP